MTQILLVEDGDWWVATDTATGITSQGETRKAALENLDEAVAGFEGEGYEPTVHKLRELEIAPEDNVVDG